MNDNPSHVNPAALAGGAGIAPLRNVAACAKRSEEHTSELQSQR